MLFVDVEFAAIPISNVMFCSNYIMWFDPRKDMCSLECSHLKITLKTLQTSGPG